MIFRTLALALSLALAGCASTSHPAALVPVSATVSDAKPVRILVATSRGLDATGSAFSTERFRGLHFQSVNVSIPPNHKEGEIEWPITFPGNPATNFVTTENDIIDEARFVAELQRRLPASGEVVVFSHGYNTKHEEAVFRFAQIAADSQMAPLAVPVLFSWPSRGAVKDYVTDRESITASRNRLDQLLRLIARVPKVKTIDILAHSMGSMLVMDTLVWAKLRGDPFYSNKVNAVVLAAPDIDVDVYLAQFEIIGNRHKPTVVMVSRDDKALAVSRRLAGDVVRVGAASPKAEASIEAIKRLGLTVIDLSQVGAKDGANHSKFATGTVLNRMHSMKLAGGLSQSKNTFGSFVMDTAGDVLSAPANILQRIAQ